jgi:xanthine dehydrogenase accessory factor
MFLNQSTKILLDFAYGCLHQRTAAIVVDIRAGRGSLPRKAGTWMLISANKSAGTIGGGHLEFIATQKARSLIEDAKKTPPMGGEHIERYALGPSLGQCCGGTVSLSYSTLTPQRLAALVAANTEQATCRFNLHLFGAGHVGAALVAALSPLPCRINWIDERQDLLPDPADLASRSPNVSVVCVDSPVAEVEAASAGDYFLVLTHSHALDLELVSAVLKRGDAGYLGLIGSATKRASFETRLLARNISPLRLHCPIGLDGIGGKEPEVIAASVAADLLRRSA